MSAVDSLTGLLQLANGFIEQSHFAEGDAEVVVGFRIFFGSRRAGFEVVLELAEHFRKIHAGILAEWRRLGSRRGAGNPWRNVWHGHSGRGRVRDWDRNFR